MTPTIDITYKKLKMAYDNLTLIDLDGFEELSAEEKFKMRKTLLLIDEKIDEIESKLYDVDVEVGKDVVRSTRQRDKYGKKVLKFRRKLGDLC